MLLQIPVELGPIKLGELLIAVALGWYMTLGPRVFLVMLGQLVLSYALVYVLSLWVSPIWPLVLIFVLAWVGQFYGHHLEGKKPSFFKDLQYLLIGPLWVVRGLF